MGRTGNGRARENEKASPEDRGRLKRGGDCQRGLPMQAQTALGISRLYSKVSLPQSWQTL